MVNTNKIEEILRRLKQVGQKDKIKQNLLQFRQEIYKQRTQIHDQRRKLQELSRTNQQLTSIVIEMRQSLRDT